MTESCHKSVIKNQLIGMTFDTIQKYTRFYIMGETHFTHCPLRAKGHLKHDQHTQDHNPNHLDRTSGNHSFDCHRYTRRRKGTRGCRSTPHRTNLPNPRYSHPRQRAQRPHDRGQRNNHHRITPRLPRSLR